MWACVCLGPRSFTVKPVSSCFFDRFNLIITQNNYYSNNINHNVLHYWKEELPTHVKLGSGSDLSPAQLFVTVMRNLLGNSVVCAYLSFYRSTGLQAIQLNSVLRQCCYSKGYSELIETKLGGGIFGRKSTYIVKHTSTGYKFSDTVKGFHTLLKTTVFVLV